jgi:endonuclease III
LKHLAQHLEAAYGTPSPFENLDPLDELIATILSQSTTNVNSQRALLQSLLPARILLVWATTRVIIAARA